LTEEYSEESGKNEFNSFLQDLSNKDEKVKILKNVFVLGNTTNGVTFEGDGHPNNKGHQVIAQHLYEYIKQNNIICSQ
jgi:lysophospholipase L1-like esterase